MDMKSNMGSFAAALKDKDVWVMNVVPEDGPNTLKLIYDRGLIGSVHSWYANQVTEICKACHFDETTHLILYPFKVCSSIMFFTPRVIELYRTFKLSRGLGICCLSRLCEQYRSI